MQGKARTELDHVRNALLASTDNRNHTFWGAGTLEYLLMDGEGEGVNEDGMEGDDKEEEGAINLPATTKLTDRKVRINKYSSYMEWIEWIGNRLDTWPTPANKNIFWATARI